MHPTAALQAAKLLVFWNAYNQAAGRWQINFRTHLNGRWEPIALLSALAPFASDEIARRLPSAVTDNAGVLWLFWLEHEGGRWQLRYNRYDGTHGHCRRPPHSPWMAAPIHVWRVLRF